MAKASSGHGHTRSWASFARSTGIRPTRKLVLLACEGAETEPRYFKALAQRLHLSVAVRSAKGGAPESTVLHALGEVKRLGACRDEVQYDEAWCIFDTDRYAQTEGFRRAIETATAQSFKLAVSNPSFEFWYLLHFENTSRPFADSDELEGFLKKHVPDYRKNLDVFDTIYPRTAIAIESAQAIQVRSATEKEPYPNPSTSVHILVRILLDLANRP
jgi:hypothetical protein